MKEKLVFKRLSRGFIVFNSAPGFPRMRRLTSLYKDQFNNKHVKLDGRYEPLCSSHKYLPID